MCSSRLSGMLSKDLFDASPAHLHTATLSAQQVTFAVVDGKRTAPEWIPLIPAGQLIIARDGRSFIANHSQAIKSFAESGMKAIPLDWDHALDSWGTAPGDGKAAAWIDVLEAREDGSLWGHIEFWTPRGRDSVESGEYRFISPVIMFDDERKVVEVPRASLVNNPALRNPALLANGKHMNEKLIALLASLGLDPTTITDEQVAKVQETFARGKNPQVDLSTHVPIEQYEQIVVELTEAKAQIETFQEETKTAKIEQVIGAALASGRLLPSEKSFFMAQAQKDLAPVEEFLNTRQLQIGKQKPLPPGQTSKSSEDTFGLSEAEQLMARKTSLTYQQFAAAKSARTQKV